MTTPPAWALARARSIETSSGLLATCFDIYAIATALAEVRREALEEANVLVNERFAEHFVRGCECNELGRASDDIRALIDKEPS